MTSLSEAFSSSSMALRKLAIDDYWKSFGPFFYGSGNLPVLIFAIFSSCERDYMFTLFILMPRWLFFVTRRGVPQSMTRLNLSYISESFLGGPLLLLPSALLFGYGARSYFFSSAILFSFSVIYGPSFYGSWILLLLSSSTFYLYCDSLTTSVFGLCILRSLSLQNSKFHN